MKNLLLYLIFLLPIVKSTSVEEYVTGIINLMQKVNTYKLPNDYGEFYHSTFIDAGLFGNYDFIIVGAGSAGTVLANRLSEIPSWKVLLLEAGQNETDFTDIPATAGLWQRTEFSWGYVTTPQQKCCLGMVNKQCNVPRGKALGGSSVINYMVYTRGSRDDYNNWAAEGNQGWSYEDLLQYFKKSEMSTLTENYDEEYHNKNGTLSVEHVKHFGLIAQAFLDGNVELGRKVLDYNGKEEIGFSRLQSTTINGRRCSGNKAFINSITERPNLQIQSKAFVTKLLIDSNTKIVKGVEFLIGNKKYTATVNKEVILSAGAVGSPKILLHSGIGPKDHLELLGIQVLADLAVGQNLADHPFVIHPFTTNFKHEETSKTLHELVEEYISGYGYLTAAGDIQALGYINTTDSKSTNPDIEIFIAPNVDVSNPFYQKFMNFRPEVFQQYLRPDLKTVTTGFFVLLHPKSRGNITLKSNNIFDHPLIDFNYFDHPEDVEIMVNALKDFFMLLETNAMKKYNFSIPYNPIEDCTQTFLSDDYLICLVKHVASSLFHLSSTCKMGPKNDPEAVVDSNLKVYKVSGLRVVDASVMPFPLAAHTNAPTYMIAEKGADIIKQTWGKI